MFKDVDCLWSSTNFTTDKLIGDNSNLELQMASLGYYHCKNGCEKSMENLLVMQNQLNIGGLGVFAILVMTGTRYACHIGDKRD